MKIEQITLRHLRMELKDHFETSFGRIHTRDCIIIETFSEGIQGYGECVADWDPGYSYETVKTAWHILEDFIIPQILHQDIQTPRELQKKIAFVNGHLMAKAGIEMSIWDLMGKQNGKSIKEMLGGEKDQVKVGVSIGIQDSIPILLEKVDSFLNQGYQRIKIKIKPGRDIEDTKAVRDAFPDIMLQVDANSAFTFENALSLIPLDDLNLLLIEQPLAEDDLWDHHKLQKKFRTPICLDESILSTRHARQAIEMDATRVINIKAGRVGGLSEAVSIHNLCQNVDIPVWSGGMLETGIGRASNLALASLPNFQLPGDISASDRYYHQDITEDQFRLNSDSTIDVPVGDGLGVSINLKALEDVTLSKETYH
jgi:o-succinylbenzoate synthase